MPYTSLMIICITSASLITSSCLASKWRADFKIQNNSDCHLLAFYHSKRQKHNKYKIIKRNQRVILASKKNHCFSHIRVYVIEPEWYEQAIQKAPKHAKKLKKRAEHAQKIKNKAYSNKQISIDNEMEGRLSQLVQTSNVCGQHEVNIEPKSKTGLYFTIKDIKQPIEPWN